MMGLCGSSATKVQHISTKPSPSFRRLKSEIKLISENKNIGGGQKRNGRYITVSEMGRLLK
jgi:hypothetical protein